MQQAGRVSDTTAFYMGELIEVDKTKTYKTGN
jgi:ABC-type phosphate transport system ATPase subunit